MSEDKYMIELNTKLEALISRHKSHTEEIRNLRLEIRTLIESSQNKDTNQVNTLHTKLEALIYSHKAYTDEIRNIRDEIRALQNGPKIENASDDKSAQKPIASKSFSIDYAPPTAKRFTRDLNKKTIGGVCAGLAKYLGINVLVVRILTLIAMFFSSGIGVVIYIILWIALPASRDFHSYQKGYSSRSSNQTEPALANSEIDAPKTHIKDTIETAVLPNRGLGKPQSRSQLEKFIGEKIISIIGIAITVIGASIGVKYSIEHDLISPTTRIILGYVLAAGLLTTAIYLKKKYETFSAILLSGSMAIFYFITFAAYSFYNIYPQPLAFGLMFLFTALTVFAAMLYNQQVIAIIGLVGAYAVPFLLSDGSGQVEILFSYVAIINVGVLIIAFKRYWKPLFFSAFVLTWIIFLAWFLNDYQTYADSYLAFFFATIFFFTFYAMFLAYKLIRKEPFEATSVIHVLSNAFIFYGIGYAVLDGNETGEHYLGLFTLTNAIIHGVVASIIYTKKDIDRNIFYLTSGLAVVFVTIAVPVQLDGSWVTMLWSAEAALLFWIGRKNQSPIYEQLSYPLILTAFVSLINLWGRNYYIELDVSLFGAYTRNPLTEPLSFLLNSTFLSSAIFIAALAFVSNLNSTLDSTFRDYNDFTKAISNLLAAMLIGVTYFAIYLEMAHYFGQLYAGSIATYYDGDYPIDIHNTDVLLYKNVTLILYTMLFWLALSYINQFKVKSKELGKVNFLFNLVIIFVFLLEGLYALSELRDSFLVPAGEGNYPVSSLHIGIRYIAIALAGVLLWRTKQLITQWSSNTRQQQIRFEGLMHLFFLWLISSEVINLMTLSGAHEQYKLSLSILWGLYAVLLIVLGIWKQKPYLRFGAIALFSVTLLKLFFYDISHLSTISKTIVFVSLGLLLLLISFLYNRFNKRIDDTVED